MPKTSPTAARPAVIITGPTSGIGLHTALALAKRGPVVLVARDRRKLADLKARIERRGGQATAVVCDLSDIASVKRAAAEILALNLPIRGLLNNAGVRETTPSKTARGWDLGFATNHLGPFALIEALAPRLPDGANVVNVVSAVENPDRQPAKSAGFRGGRYISAEASARGDWKAGGSAKPGYDAYATSKQALLAATLALAREDPRLRYAAVEPGLTPETGLGGRRPGPVAKLVVPVLVRGLMPFLKFLSTPQRAARVLTAIVTDPHGETGVYYDEGGRPMRGSPLVHDPAFQDRVFAETRALLAASPSP